MDEKKYDSSLELSWEDCQLLRNFRLDKVLSNNIQRKSIICLGRFIDCRPDTSTIVSVQTDAKLTDDTCPSSNKSDALLFINKSAFGSETIIADIFNEGLVLKIQMGMINDIYKNFVISGMSEFDSLDCRLIYPATDSIIAKYLPKTTSFFNETYQLHYQIIRPYLHQKIATDNSLLWIDNIFSGTAEADRILYNSAKDASNSLNGLAGQFIILNDYKWSGNSIEDLYLLVLFNDKSLLSIRDLTDEHLPLLKQARQQIQHVLSSMFNISELSSRVYFHYLPTFYRLHLHVVSMSNISNTIGPSDHLLDTVIDNIENIDKAYYQRATIPIIINDTTEISQLYRDQIDRA